MPANLLDPTTAKTHPSFTDPPHIGWMKSTERDQAIELQVFRTLESDTRFRGRSRWIQCRCLDGKLYLTGKLPTYYLKQLVQETLRRLKGVEQIVNGIDVVTLIGNASLSEKNRQT